MPAFPCRVLLCPPPVALLTPMPALSHAPGTSLLGLAEHVLQWLPTRGRKGMNQDKGSAAVMRALVGSGFDKGDKYDVLCADGLVTGLGLMWQLRGVGAQAPSALSAVPGGCPVCSAQRHVTASGFQPERQWRAPQQTTATLCSHPVVPAKPRGHMCWGRGV